MQPHCPFCRDEFSLQDIRILRVDNDAPSSTTVAPQLDTQVQRLLDDIAQTASGGGTVEEMERVIVLCDAYHNAQPRSSPVRDRPETRKATDWSLQHTPLGVSYLLLSTLLEAQRKLFSQADQLSELTAARDDIRDRLSLELEASRLQYQNSERARDNEKEAALSNEEALRVQYKKMNALWICKVESTQRTCQSLHEELNRPPAFRSNRERFLILVCNIILASIGCALFLYASAAVLQLGVK
jgi:hypothetical protein